MLLNLKLKRLLLFQDLQWLFHAVFMTEFLLLHICQFLIKVKIFHVCSMCNISFVLSFYLRILQYFVSLTKIGSKTLKDQWMEQGNNKKKKMNMRQTYSVDHQWYYRFSSVILLMVYTVNSNHLIIMSINFLGTMPWTSMSSLHSSKPYSAIKKENPILSIIT